MRRFDKWALAYSLTIFVVASHCAPLSVLSRVDQIWSDVAQQAAEETVRTLTRKTGLSLRIKNVPRDRFQVFVGRQHKLALEVDGVTYEVVLNSEADRGDPKDALPGSQVLPALPGNEVLDPWQYQQRRIALPEVTLAGPVELLLTPPCGISAYIPHLAEVSEVRRILLAAGVTVRLIGLKSITLRRPVTLPTLPGSYLAEAIATAVLGRPEPGFENAPGALYLSKELYQRALNRSSTGKQGPLLSFLVEPGGGGSGISLMTASEVPDGKGPRLKLKKREEGTLDISLRDQVVPSDKGLTHPWAWPLPHVNMSHWIPYESLLRGILASKAFDMKRVQQEGIALKLKESSVSGVSLLHFDMDLIGEDLSGDPTGANILETFLTEGDAKQYSSTFEKWEALVQVKEKAGGGLEYIPVSVQRKDAYYSTLTLAPGAMKLLSGGGAGDMTGYESYDLGIARNAE